MLCAVIKEPTLEKIAKANDLADLIELRIDLFERPTVAEVKQLREACSVPVIFTGGEQFLSCRPDYVDLPYDADKALFEKCSDFTRICSLHDFKRVPDDLDRVFSRPAEIYKVAAYASSSLDALKMLSFVKKSKKPTIGIAMGECGVATRILSPVVGSPFTYAPLEEEDRTAPGQLLLEELVQRYRFRELGKKTALFALLGDPVSQSPSHIVHNIAFKELGYDAVYVKMQVSSKELPTFLPLAFEVGFRGFSVTIPHKESVVPLLDKTPNDVRAINTVLRKRTLTHGWNTDGVGALEAIERKMLARISHKHSSRFGQTVLSDDKESPAGRVKLTLPRVNLKSDGETDGQSGRTVCEKSGLVKGKKIVLLGAGGTALAIAAEAKKRGAEVIVVNRTLKRAERISDASFTPEEFPQVAKEGYDILVNCTPTLPIDVEDLLWDRLVMDVRLQPRITPLLEAAKEKGCMVVDGWEMFVLQAAEQYGYWFGKK